MQTSGTLAAEVRGGNGLEGHLEQELQVGNMLIVADALGLGVTSRVGIDLLTGGILGVTVAPPVSTTP